MEEASPARTLYTEKNHKTISSWNCNREALLLILFQEEDQEPVQVKETVDDAPRWTTSASPIRETAAFQNSQVILSHYGSAEEEGEQGIEETTPGVKALC